MNINGGTIMNPTVIDGNLLKLLITNGSVALRNDHERINDLNVFPVPDGDTGSNMQSTMMSGVEAISGLENERVDKVAKTLSRGLLMGARGNSGVILSQLFSGFAKTFKGLETVNSVEFVEGLIQGVKQAYGAVINPVEGTILTVAREAAEKAVLEAKEETGLLDIMRIYLEEAEASLERTPEMLAVLKEAGVVDSGGAGFNVIIEGIIKALEGEILEEGKFSSSPGAVANISSYEVSAEEFGYCTEFVIQFNGKKEFNEDKFVKRIGRFGDSLALVSDDEILKVHIHTKNPGDVLNFGQQFGSFLKLKIENMSLQHSELVEKGREPGHIVAQEQISGPAKKYGILTVVNGDGLKDTFREMGASVIIDGGQTMNPSTEDFITAIEKINAEHIIIIPNNGNVMLSAQHAAKYLSEYDISVVSAKTIAQGYASLTMFDANQDLADNIAEMEELIQNVVTGEITYAVRDTEFNGIKINRGDFIGIKDGEIIASEVDRLSAVNNLVKELVTDDAEIVTIMFGEGVKEEELEAVMLNIETQHPDVEVEVIEGEQEIYSYIIAVE